MNDTDVSEALSSVSNGLVGQENNHLFVVEFVKLIDKFALPNKKQIIKRYLMTVLKQFSSSTSRTVHFETFPLWLLLEKYSETMDIRRILDHINHLYDDWLPYYRVYINELLSKNQECEARKMLETCKIKCGLTEEQAENEFPTLKVEAAPISNSSTFGKTSISIGHLYTEDETLCSQTESMILGDNCVTVEKIAECYKQDGGFLGMLIASLLGAQLARLLSSVDPAKLTPQSVLISAPLEESLTPENLVEKCILKVVEKSKISNAEAQSRSSGFLDVVGYLLFLDSFNVLKIEDGQFTPDKIIARRFPDRDVWISLFQRLLNDKSNSTNWSDIADELKQKFIELASTKKTIWSKSVHDFNKHFNALAAQ